MVDLRCHAVAVDLQGECVGKGAADLVRLDKLGYVAVCTLGGRLSDVNYVYGGVWRLCEQRFYFEVGGDDGGD